MNTHTDRLKEIKKRLDAIEQEIQVIRIDIDSALAVATEIEDKILGKYE